jgi:pSer/pThr/pTyr-binding forkhead associated (FHA) protein
VRIPEAEVSRRHCRLVQKDGFVVIEDLKSINGTYVNGVPVSGAQAIRPGDAVEVGPLRFIVGYELTSSAKSKLETFATDVELLPEDSGPDFLEDVEGIEWIEEDLFEDAAGEKDVPDALELIEDKPTEYKKKPRVMSDDDDWVLPTDLQLTDLMESPEENKKKRRP